MIATKEAVRICRAPTAAACSRSLREIKKRSRGAFIGCSRPSIQSARHARTAGVPGYSSRVCKRTSSAVGVGIVSSSMIQIQSACGNRVRARAMPAANPPAPPVLVGSATTWAPSGWVEATSPEASVDALSTTTAPINATVWSASPSRHRRSSSWRL